MPNETKPGNVRPDAAMDPQRAFVKLREMIKDVKVAMMTTIDEEGALRSRPMMTQEAQDDGLLWFFTQKHGGKADEVLGDERVNLAYAAPDKHRYVSVSGTAAVVKDKERMKALWNPVYKAWFPRGLEDPDLSLLRVAVSKAEYWDAPSSKWVQLLGFTKAALTGTPHKADAEEHLKMRIRPQPEGPSPSP